MNRQAFNPKLTPVFHTANFKGDGIPVVESENVHLGLIIGAALHGDNDKDIKVFHLCIVDMDAPDRPLTTIPMDFFGHGVVPDPNNPERVVVFEKRGSGACEIDLKQGKMLRKITTADNRQFYGHGAFSTDGKLLYCTETIMEGEHEGVIAVRDAETHEYLGEFPSFGSHPHDCQLINNGKTMVITNGGGDMDGIAPSVTYIDVETKSLIEKIEFDADYVNAGHFDITSDGKLGVVSAQRSGLPEKAIGGVSIRQGDTLHTITQPEKLVERLYNESLSICINERNDVMGATTPDGNLLTFWNMNDGSLLQYYIMESPRGIQLTLDGNYFIVSFGKGDNVIEGMCVIDANTLEHIQGQDLSNTGVTGSHLISYALPQELRS